MIKLPEDMKAKWLEALRSGKYKQTKEVLKDGNGYCCLGVLQCVVDGDVEKPDLNSLYMTAREYLAFPSFSWILEKLARKEHDTDTAIGNAENWEEAFRGLAEMNDDGCSFEDIANVIERTL